MQPLLQSILLGSLIGCFARYGGGVPRNHMTVLIRSSLTALMSDCGWICMPGPEHGQQLQALPRGVHAPALLRIAGGLSFPGKSNQALYSLFPSLSKSLPREH